LESNKEQDGMYRIRFHGRGGQGMKTASRILGTAFFLEGFQVQDAPRYGAERRGAPIFAYVRASRQAICERGIIGNPDLVIVADETLIPVPVAEVLTGITGRTVLLVNSSEKPEVWQERLAIAGPVHTLPTAAEVEDVLELRFIGAACAGAAARLVGVISRSSLEQAINSELAHLGKTVVDRNLTKALEPYDLMAPHAGCVTPGGGISATDYRKPDWVELPFEDARVATPAVFAPTTSDKVKTGLWRTMRPVINHSLCSRCWLCSTYCPEGGISIDEEGYPQIDYDHCKGCLVCMAQCPSHAIRSVPEHIGETEGERGEGK
jgi:pyruvate ferredoxin oxidoreductase gamma subunit